MSPTRREFMEIATAAIVVAAGAGGEHVAAHESRASDYQMRLAGVDEQRFGTIAVNIEDESVGVRISWYRPERGAVDLSTEDPAVVRFFTAIAKEWALHTVNCDVCGDRGGYTRMTGEWAACPACGEGAA